MGGDYDPLQQPPASVHLSSEITICTKICILEFWKQYQYLLEPALVVTGNSSVLGGGRCTWAAIWTALRNYLQKINKYAFRSHVQCGHTVCSEKNIPCVFFYNFTEDKYLIISLPENKKYGAKRLLKWFLTKTGVLVDWKCWSEKNWQHRYCCSTYWAVVDLALSVQYLWCQFFWSMLSVHQDFSFC